MMKFTKIFMSVLLLTAAVVSGACSKAQEKPTVWIYTSAYPETVAELDKAIKAKFPDINVQWFQNGSENVHAKIALERLSKNVQADLVLTSDLFWFKKMAAENFWQNYQAKTAYEIPAAFQGADGAYTTARVSAMVIGYNKKVIADADAPQKFADLVDPKWKDKITSGSPLESGTQNTLMNSLVYKYGYDFLKQLRANDLVAAGGNSAVMKRLVTGEKPVAMVLLENLLAEQKNNPNIGIVYPQDGVVLAPGPLALVKKEGVDQVAAQKIYDFLLSDSAQSIFVAGNMYVFDKNVAGPAGAKSFDDVIKASFDTNDAFYNFVQKEDAGFKDKFSDIILN